MAIDFTAMNNALHSAFGKHTLTYTPLSGQAVTGITACKGQCQVEMVSADGQVLSPEKSCTFIVKQADLSGLTPAHGDSISDGSKTYDVHSADPDSESLNWRIHCLEKG